MESYFQKWRKFQIKIGFQSDFYISTASLVGDVKLLSKMEIKLIGLARLADLMLTLIVDDSVNQFQLSLEKLEQGNL